MGAGQEQHGLGETYNALGDYAQARRQYEDAVAVRNEISDQWGVARSLDAWGDTERRLGDLARARELWSQALAVLNDLGDGHSVAVEGKLAATFGPAAG